MRSASIVTLSDRLAAKSNDGAMTNTSNSKLIASAATVELFQRNLRIQTKSGQLAEHTTAANRISGTKGLRTIKQPTITPTTAASCAYWRILCRTGFVVAEDDSIILEL